MATRHWHDKRGWKLLVMGYRNEYVCERGEISLG